METKDRKIDGLTGRHVAQIVRRKMIQQVKPSGKAYDRKKFKKELP
jgi:hypothetical protein